MSINSRIFRSLARVNETSTAERFGLERIDHAGDEAAVARARLGMTIQAATAVDPGTDSPDRTRARAQPALRPDHAHRRRHRHCRLQHRRSRRHALGHDQLRIAHGDRLGDPDLLHRPHLERHHLRGRGRRRGHLHLHGGCRPCRRHYRHHHPGAAERRRDEPSRRRRDDLRLSGRDQRADRLPLRGRHRRQQHDLQRQPRQYRPQRRRRHRHRHRRRQRHVRRPRPQHPERRACSRRSAARPTGPRTTTARKIRSPAI